MATVPVTILPYMGEQRGDHFDRHQFIKPARVVKARYTREGWETTGIAFSEVSTKSGGNIHVDHREVATHRRNPTRHEWAMNDASVQKVVLNYCEARLYLRDGDKLTVEERLRRIDKAAADALPYKKVLLRDAMEQYTLAEKDHAPKEELRRRKILVENHDSEIMILRRGVVKLATLVAYHSYRLGKNSAQVAEELGLRPPAVRMFLYRLNRRAVGLSSSYHASIKYKRLPRRSRTSPSLCRT